MTAIAWIAGLDRDDDLHLRRWLIAAIIVAAVHATLAGIYLILAPKQVAPGSISPPILIDFAPDAAAPDSVADLAPGPEAAEAQAQPEPEVAPQVQEQPIIEVPIVQTPEPEIVLPPKKEVVEKEPEDAKPTPPQPVKETKRTPQVQSSPRATSNPKVTKRAVAAAAPNPGNAAASRAMPEYRALIAAHLQRHKQYPAAARSGGQQGTVVVSFTIDRNGRVVSRNLARSSGSSILDTEVMAMIARANPMPPFPSAVTESQMAFSVPIRFSVR